MGSLIAVRDLSRALQHTAQHMSVMRGGRMKILCIQQCAKCKHVPATALGSPPYSPTFGAGTTAGSAPLRPLPPSCTRRLRASPDHSLDEGRRAPGPRLHQQPQHSTSTLHARAVLIPATLHTRCAAVTRRCAALYGAVYCRRGIGVCKD